MKLPEAESVARLRDEVWAVILAHFPPGPELERLARTTGALVRKRHVRSASDLLRVALSYGFCGLTFKLASLYSRSNGSASLSGPALFRRIQKCGDWLESLVTAKLRDRMPSLVVAGLRVRLVDATRISTPGSKGATWRVHADYDPFGGRLVGLQVTDNQGGERLSRFDIQPGDLLIGDRAYAQRRGLAHVVNAGGQFLVRHHWHSVPLEHRDGRSFDLFGILKGIPDSGPVEFEVRTQGDTRHGLPALDCRLIAVRKSEEAAEAARKKARAEAKRKKAVLDPRTLEACGYFLVLTSVSTQRLDTEQVLALYRLRWQVELEFKRLKSLLDLDEVRAKDPRTVRAALLARLLGALVVEDLCAVAVVDPEGPVPLWALTDHFGSSLKQAIQGIKSARQAILDPASAYHWLCDTPRNRLFQGAVVYQMLASHS